MGQQRAAIYARVLTADQSCERQLRDLAAFAERGGFVVVGRFMEIASGAKDSRGERKRVLALGVCAAGRFRKREVGIRRQMPGQIAPFWVRDP